jgi:cytochrome P450
MRRDPLAFLLECARQYGDVVRIRHLPWSSYLFVHPRDVKHILQGNHRNYTKGIVFQKLKRIAGEGLVFSDGDLWRRQRRLIQPAFHRQRIAAFADMMVEATAAMLERWRTRRSDTGLLDVAAEMSRLTLEIVARALFGAELGGDRDKFIGAVTRAMSYANHLANHFFNPPTLIPTPANLKGRRAIRDIDSVVWKMITNRRAAADGQSDLLSMLLHAHDAETDSAMDDRQLRDESVTFLVAGHETTAVALSWTWHLLGNHPDVEARLHEELGRVLNGRPPVLSDLDRLPYTRMVLEEAMRLYPPAWATSRQAVGDDEVGGRRVRAETMIILSPYVTHRHPELWPDPERFDPGRFSAEDNATRPDYAYFPFGGGPRGCVGREFAMMEGRLILASVAQQFRFRPQPGRRVEPDPVLTLRPRGGLPMLLDQRRK